MIESQSAKRIATLLHALGEPSRLLLIARLVRGTACVKDLAAAVGQKMVNVSHHLGVLRDAGLVTVERRGRHRFYAVSPTRFHNSIPDALGAFEADGFRVVVVGPNAPSGGKKPSGKKRK